MWNKLKKRWNIDSDFQVIIILVVFALTGSSSVFVKDYIFEKININNETTALHWRIPLYILIILPAYQVLLLFFGFIFGQFAFFWAFVKKMLRIFGMNPR